MIFNFTIYFGWKNDIAVKYNVRLERKNRQAQILFILGALSVTVLELTQKKNHTTRLVM